MTSASPLLFSRWFIFTQFDHQRAEEATKSTSPDVECMKRVFIFLLFTEKRARIMQYSKHPKHTQAALNCSECYKNKLYMNQSLFTSKTCHFNTLSLESFIHFYQVCKLSICLTQIHTTWNKYDCSSSMTRINLIPKSRNLEKLYISRYLSKQASKDLNIF